MCIRDRGHTGVEDGVSAKALNGVLKLDVPPVDGQREPRDEVRLDHGTDRPGRALLRVQVRVAAKKTVVLAGRVRLWRLTNEKPLRETAVVGSRDRMRARIVAAVQADELRS